MKLLIINGPNLSTLGRREPAFYGKIPFETALDVWKKRYPQCHLSYFQSDLEGELIKTISNAETNQEGIILNGGAFSHTSIALHDAIRGLSIPVIEVHISNIFARESFRHHSFLSSVCRGSISGFGLDGYRLAIEAFLEMGHNVDH